MDIPAILISQYQASLEMLKQTITQCPESVWNAASDKNKFWQVAYHALFFTHQYLARLQRSLYSVDQASGWIRRLPAAADLVSLMIEILSWST